MDFNILEQFTLYASILCMYTIILCLLVYYVRILLYYVCWYTMYVYYYTMSAGILCTYTIILCLLVYCVRILLYYVCWYTMYDIIRFNFCVVKLLQIASFHDFCVFIFTVRDVTAHLLPVWSKLSRDETFADGY